MRSDSEACPPEADCFVIDAMGELMRYYACCDVAFVGGTFADIGGHNLLEPAALGKPVLFGPHTYNTEQVARALEEAGGGRRLQNEDALVNTLLDLFGDPEARSRSGQSARALVESGRGALALNLSVIRRYIDRT